MASAGNIALTLAINDSDQVRDVVSGVVPVEGIDLTTLLLPVEEIFFRFTLRREWEISELSMAKYCALRARGDTSLTAIPVFPSRAFRHSSIYVRSDGPVDEPQALAGARIGTPEWAVTATVYARALLVHEYGVELAGVDWVQAGTNQPGRIETLDTGLPPGVTIRAEPQRSLNEMLVAGDIDAIIAPHPPEDFDNGSGRIVRLFSDCRAAERAYYKRTGLFPIMHVVTIRADVYDRHPWVAVSLYKAFEAAKRRSVERQRDVNAPRVPIPWAAGHADEVTDLFGGDPWPYGIEPNRVTLEAFLQYGLEQGLNRDRITPEDLFAVETSTTYRV